MGFSGSGSGEKAVVIACNNPHYLLLVGKIVIEVDPEYYRPTEVDLLLGDATKAREKLGWWPKHGLQQLVAEMVAADLKVMANGHAGKMEERLSG